MSKVQFLNTSSDKPKYRVQSGHGQAFNISHHEINGDSNTICGDNNVINGDNNCVIGNNNHVTGTQNEIRGKNNVSKGCNTVIIEETIESSPVNENNNNNTSIGKRNIIDLTDDLTTFQKRLCAIQLPTINQFLERVKLIESQTISNYGNKRDDVPPSPTRENDEFKCPICFDKIKSGAMDPCMHTFCFDCAKKCFELKPECPICKRKVNKVCRLY